MSVSQYQNKLNTLDKEITDLEKKKAAADKKAADEEAKASKISWTKNASAATIKSKMNQIGSHKKAANKAKSDSADLAKKLAYKRQKRNDAYKQLQKEEHSEQKKRNQAELKMREKYEARIAELEAMTMPTALPADKGNDAPMQESDYDVFVSHAWEDKEDFVDEFVEELKKLNLSVWYDTNRIKWGDSMRQEIDEGLRHSKFGVVVLSPNYIADGKYWTKAELNGLFQLESINGKVILPIWHNLTKKQVMDFSPIIANKKAMTTATMTAQEIASELIQLLPDNTEEDN